MTRSRPRIAWSRAGPAAAWIEWHDRCQAPTVEVRNERVGGRQHRHGDEACGPATIRTSPRGPSAIASTSERAAAELIENGCLVGGIGQTPRAMSHTLVGFDSKKKLWRPCREARAQGL